MKKIPTVLLFMFLIVLGPNLKGQDTQKRFHFGPRIGVALTDMKYKDRQYDDFQFVHDTIAYTNPILNVMVGLTADYVIIPAEKYGLSVQASLMYSRKGCWMLIENGCCMLIENVLREVVAYFHYMDIPVELRGKCRISKRNYLVLGIGPTFNIGISQVNNITEYRSHEANKTFNKDVQFGNSEEKNGLHRLDIGANATLGIESTRGFRFDLAYYIPIRNLSIDKSKSIKFFEVSASVGYMF